jgi:hypothetical protein
MNRLASRRPRGCARPQVEALEDRCVLNAAIKGVGQIATTGTANHVLITDDGNLIRVFSDNSPDAPLATFEEGAPLTVSTNKPGSSNTVFYAVLGSSSIFANGPVIHANLTVNFGSGFGWLSAKVASGLPNGLMISGWGLNFFNLGNLGDSSTLKITTNSSGTTREDFGSRDIGQSASVQIEDNGGKGGNQFQVGLVGAQKPASVVNVTFRGNTGADLGLVTDSQYIPASAGAIFNLNGQAGNDAMSLTYAGILQGILLVGVAGGATPGPKHNIEAPRGHATLTLDFEFQNASSGSLLSIMKGADGNDLLEDIVHKVAGGAQPNVIETADGGGGFDNASFTQDSPTSVHVSFTNIASPVLIVP